MGDRWETSGELFRNPNEILSHYPNENIGLLGKACFLENTVDRRPRLFRELLHKFADYLFVSNTILPEAFSRPY